MTDLISEAQLVLRNAGFETWEIKAEGVRAAAFESAALLGFVYLFESTSSLLENWRATEQATLKSFAARFKLAGDKAWNVYSIFIASDSAAGLSLSEIEEDLSLTRKIARNGLQSTAEITKALISILPIQSMPTLTESDFSERVSAHLAGVGEFVFEALQSDSSPGDVAGMLLE